MSDVWAQLRETDPELWAEAKAMERAGRHPSPTVVIVCEDGHRRRKVETYTRDEHDEWTPRAAHEASVRARLVDDVPTDGKSVRALRTVGGRDRDALVCSACQMSVPVRDERLQVILSGVWEAAGSPDTGVSHLSLRGLDAVA